MKHTIFYSKNGTQLYKWTHTYEGCSIYFWPNENANIYHQNLFKPLVEALFPLRSRHLQNMVFERFTASSGGENRWPLIFFLTCWNKKKSLGANSGLYGNSPINSTFWPEQWFVFFCSFFSPMTFGKQMVVYHSELNVLQCSSGTVATWPVLQKKQANICNKIFYSY